MAKTYYGVEVDNPCAHYEDASREMEFRFHTLIEAELFRRDLMDKLESIGHDDHFEFYKVSSVFEEPASIFSTPSEAFDAVFGDGDESSDSD